MFAVQKETAKSRDRRKCGNEPAHAGSFAQPALALRRTSCACGGDCPQCLQRRPHETDVSEGPLDPGSGAVPPIIHDVLSSPGEPLDSATRAFMDPGFGRDFSNVRVHTDAKAAESARSVDALAYTVGRDVVFAAGHYAPRTQAGARLIAHELAHTLQNPAPTRVSPSLEIGPVDDPAERAADSAADAVMRGEKAPLAPSGGAMLRRQPRTCTAGPADQPDRRAVRCSDGGEYRVTLTSKPGPRQPKTETSVSAGWNDTDIFMNIDICRGGTAVRVRPDVDLPRAVGQALGNVLAGSNALTGATLSPGLEITVLQSDSFKLTLGPKVNVDRTGVTGGGLSASVETADITAKGEVTYDAPSRTGFLTFTFSTGSPQQHVDCTKEGRERLVFDCERITHIPAVPEVAKEIDTDIKIVDLFFEHAQAEFRRDVPRPIKRIKDLIAEGYRVKSIKGFTSPEGLREQKAGKKAKGFHGNDPLSDDRADAALKWLKENCPTCDVSDVKPKGLSELPPEEGSKIPEPIGPEMERDAVNEFLGVDPKNAADRLAPHDPADVEAFRKLPLGEQRERAFKLMRRAEIILTRDRVIQQHKAGVPARDETSGVACDPDVVDAARAGFGISIATGAKIRP